MTRALVAVVGFAGETAPAAGVPHWINPERSGTMCKLNVRGRRCADGEKRSRLRRLDPRPSLNPLKIKGRRSVKACGRMKRLFSETCLLS